MGHTQPCRGRHAVDAGGSTEGFDEKRLRGAQVATSVLRVAPSRVRQRVRTTPSATTAQVEQKSSEAPDETRSFERGKAEVITIGDSEIGRLTFEPGCKWSHHVKPLAGTDLCEAPHFQYHVQGVMRLQLEDGSEFDAHPR